MAPVSKKYRQINRNSGLRYLHRLHSNGIGKFLTQKNELHALNVHQFYSRVYLVNLIFLFSPFSLAIIAI